MTERALATITGYLRLLYFNRLNGLHQHGLISIIKSRMDLGRHFIKWQPNCFKDDIDCPSGSNCENS